MPVLKALTRKILGKKVRKLRKVDKIPAVVYGHGLASRAIEVEGLSFEKIFEEVGESSLLDLVIDDKAPVKVLVHDLQFNPLSNKISHIDFYQIKEKEKVTVEVELKFIGESLAVKEKGGTLVHNLTKIKIECLPNDLVHEIEVNVFSLNDFNDLIRIKDIKIPPGIKVLQDLEEVVVSVSAPKAEGEVKVEEKPVEVKPTEEEPTVDKKPEEKPTEKEK